MEVIAGMHHFGQVRGKHCYHRKILRNTQAAFLNRPQNTANHPGIDGDDAGESGPFLQNAAHQLIAFLRIGRAGIGLPAQTEPGNALFKALRGSDRVGCSPAHRRTDVQKGNVLMPKSCQVLNAGP